VERKHNHILEIARAIRLQVALPLYFWGDCALTATNLINILPSSVLKNKTLFEILLQRAPNYQHLRVFGCLVVGYNPSKVKDKFQPGVHLVIFLDKTQKGYKLLKLITRTTFVTRDVVLFKHIFPYKKSSVAQCF